MQRMSKIMKSFEEVVESEEEEEGVEEEEKDEDAYDEAPVIPPGKRQSRQSNIVVVNTGALEIHLRQMKKQLLRHEAEIAHPSWMDKLMEQVNKIPVLEKCYQDMSMLKTGSVPSSVNSTSYGSTLEQLRSQLDTLQQLMHRVDTLECTDSERSKRLDLLKRAVEDGVSGSLNRAQEMAITSKSVADRAILLAIRGPISLGLDKLTALVHERQICCLRRRFIYWRMFDPFGVKSRGRRFLSLTASSARKVDKRTAFSQWRSKYARQQRVERIEAYLSNILSRWLRRSQPTTRNSFLHWKQYVFSMRVSELPRTCIPPSHQQELRMNMLIDEEYAGSVATGKLPMSRDPAMQKRSHIVTYRSLIYDRLVAAMDPRRDPSGCFKLIGRYMDDINRDVAYGYHLTDEVDFRVNQTNKMIDKTKADINQKFDAKVDGLESALNYHKTSSLTLLNDFKKEHRIVQEDNATKLKEHSEHLQKIDGKIGEIMRGMEEQNEKIERLFTLHGSMLSRIDRIEEVQEGAVKNIQELLSDMTAAKSCIARTSDDLAIHQQNNDRIISCIDADIAALQEQSRQAEEYMNNVLTQQMQRNKQTVSEIQGFHKKISGFESWLRETAPLSPTPNDIAALCFLYEGQAIEKHAQGQQSMRFAFTPDIVKPLTRHAQCLAEHIVRSTDIDILVSIVHGPKSSLLKTVDPATEAAYRSETDALIAKHEDICTSSRERYVARFMDAFFNILDKDERPAGVVRDEARLIFIRKFLNCLDLALSKLDTIVLGANTALGRNNSNPNSSAQAASCIACDRPLRVRIATNEPGKLEERLAKLEHKITAATLRSSNNNNNDAAGGHVNTIVVTRPGSASPAMATLTEAHHEDDDAVADKERAVLSLQSEDREVAPVDIKMRMSPVEMSKTTGASTIPKQQSKQRPASAGVLRHRIVLQETKHQQPLRESPSEPTFIKRGGFKMPKAASASQESLVNNLTSKYQRDASISAMHGLPDNKIQPTSNITMPRTYNRTAAGVDTAELTSRPLTGQHSRQALE